MVTVMSKLTLTVFKTLLCFIEQVGLETQVEDFDDVTGECCIYSHWKRKTEKPYCPRHTFIRIQMSKREESKLELSCGEKR